MDSSIDTRLTGPRELDALLAASGEDCLLLSPLPAPVAEVRFVGSLAGRRVLWRMRLCTLDRFVEERGPARDWPASPRGAMYLEPESAQAWRAHVGLAVSVIDQPVVRKAMVMMRNYRALRPGLRVWGEGPRS